ncbi:hypothetical protein EDD86DRAFT_198230 [Gorgonomyces haynaldii]|nr:hypothetical protein EDD86DRAFT_198230 [Gorgonomyces haynaldii]
MQLLTPLPPIPIPVSNVKPWRMNLTYMEAPRIFLAVADKIEVRNMHTGLLERVIPSSTNRGLLDAVNCLRGGHLGTVSSLVVVFESGLVDVYDLSEAQERLILSFDNRVSTWGIAIQSERQWIAVSSNSHFITLYDLKTGTQRQFQGHDHNIPGIEFMGDYLVSCSIDGTCRIWNGSDGQLLHTASHGEEWKWCVRHLSKTDAQVVDKHRIQRLKDDPIDVPLLERFQSDPVLQSDCETGSGFGSPDQRSVDSMESVQHSPLKRKSDLEEQIGSPKKQELSKIEEPPIPQLPTLRSLLEQDIPEDLEEMDEDWSQQNLSETESLEYESSIEEWVTLRPKGEISTNDLILLTSKNHVYLLDQELRLICGLSHLHAQWDIRYGLERNLFDTRLIYGRVDSQEASASDSKSERPPDVCQARSAWVQHRS